MQKLVDNRYKIRDQVDYAIGQLAKLTTDNTARITIYDNSTVEVSMYVGTYAEARMMLAALNIPEPENTYDQARARYILQWTDCWSIHWRIDVPCT